MNRCSLLILLLTSTVLAADRPNILWLSCEDISAHLGCYGDPHATTPGLDALAKQSVLFRHAYTTAGVCAPSRSAIITGMYQTTLGTHHMRCNAKMPPHVKPFTTWLRDSGYYCTNNSKQDYQFKTPRDAWDESGKKAHYRQRPAGAPFFAVFNYTGCHESGIASDSKYASVTKNVTKHDRDKTAESLPPYYPDSPATREDWGRYYDTVTAMDLWVTEHLKALADAGLDQETIVVFWSDHGVGLPRAKRWLYESGTHVPLMVRIPERWQKLAGASDAAVTEPGSESDRMISMIDLGPTTLSLAGLAVPDHMQGQAFYGPQSVAERKYIFGARDRMDERYDIIRMVRDRQFRYIRNYEPYKTWYQFMNTPEKGQTMKALREYSVNGQSEAVMQFFASRKPVEELYDVAQDPHELNNLAENSDYQQHLERLRAQHLKWVVETRDIGLIPEAEIHRLRVSSETEFQILNSMSPKTVAMIRDVAVMAGRPAEDDVPKLVQWLESDVATVRYWAATGLGSDLLADVFPQGQAAPVLKQLLSDESENVQVAAARTLMLRTGQKDAALATLVKVLDDGSQWARVHAAIVLDELEEDARPVVQAMERNKAYRKGLVADGKYAVRVLNKALNDLNGTSETVP